MQAGRFGAIFQGECAGVPSAIWRLKTRPMPEPPGLVVKNGTKRLAVPARPGPSSVTQISTIAPSRRQPAATDPPVMSEASGRVAQEVDQGLLDLVRVALYGDGRARLDADGDAGFKGGGAVDALGDAERLHLRTGQLGQARVGAK